MRRSLATLGELAGIALPPCHRKRGYPSKGAAYAALRSLHRRPERLREPETLTVYGPCRFCQKFHVGHDRKEM